MKKEEIIELKDNLYVLLDTLKGEVSNLFDNSSADEVERVSDIRLCQMALSKIAWQINYLTVVQHYLEEANITDEANDFFEDCVETIKEDIENQYLLHEVFDADDIARLFHLIFK